MDEKLSIFTSGEAKSENTIVFHPRDEMYPLFTHFNQIFFIFYAHIPWLPKVFDSETADLLR